MSPLRGWVRAFGEVVDTLIAMRFALRRIADALEERNRIALAQGFIYCSACADPPVLGQNPDKATLGVQYYYGDGPCPRCHVHNGLKARCEVGSG